MEPHQEVPLGIHQQLGTLKHRLLEGTHQHLDTHQQQLVTLPLEAIHHPGEQVTLQQVGQAILQQVVQVTPHQVVEQATLLPQQDTHKV